MADIPTPERVALVRRRYLEGATVRAISVQSGITNIDTIYRCVDGRFPDGSGVKCAPIPRRRAGVRIRGRGGNRVALAARMWRTAEWQVEEIEQRLRAAGLDPAEREGNARTLATLARTLRELAAFDETQQSRERRTQNKADDDDHPPRNIDQFRHEVARRLEALLASRADAGGDGDPQ